MLLLRSGWSRSLFLCHKFSWSEETRPAWNGCLHAFTLSGELLVIHNPQPCPGEGRVVAKSSLQKHMCDSSGLQIRLRCGWLAVWLREVSEICQQLLHQECYGFSNTQTSQIWGCWIAWAYFNDQSGSAGLSQGLGDIITAVKGETALSELQGQPYEGSGVFLKTPEGDCKIQGMGDGKWAVDQIYRQARARLEQIKDSVEEFNSSDTGFESEGYSHGIRLSILMSQSGSTRKGSHRWGKAGSDYFLEGWGRPSFSLSNLI